MELVVILAACAALSGLAWTLREGRAGKLSLATAGVITLSGPDRDSVLACLPQGYEFLDYRYTISGCSLSTFHRDVTSSAYEFGTRHPVYTMIHYLSDGDLLSVVPGSHRSVPFVWGRPVTISGARDTCVLFDCDVLHAGVLSRDPEREAMQYKIAHREDLPLLAGLQGIDGAAHNEIGASRFYDWFARKISLAFPFLINHVFTRHLQISDGSVANRFLLRLVGRAFYNKG
jgi:hypothetical protein